MTTMKLLKSYTQRGWAVFAVGPDKKPLCKWRHVSAPDPDLIRNGDNVALDCGKSGLVALDLDVKGDADGLAAWEALASELGIDEAQALVTETPSGGRHLIWQDPTGGLIGNSTGQLPAGIDVRGNGGYIVAPPSVTPGGPYRWIRDGNPEPLPPELVKLLLDKPKPKPQPIEGKQAVAGRRQSAYAQAALEREAEAVASTPAHTGPHGGRNGQLNASAFALGQLVGAGELDRGDVETELYNAAASCGLIADDGEKAVNATIRSGVDAGERDPRRIPAPQPPSGAQTAHRSAPGPQTARTQGTPGNIPGSSYLLAAGADDEGNAQCVNHLRGKEFLFCEAYGWLTWTGTHWSRDHAEERLNRAIVGTLKRRRVAAVQAQVEAVVKAAKPSSYRVRGAKYLFKSLRLANVDTFDQSPNHLNVKNGVLDLRTGDLEPHNPSQRFTYCLPVAYDPQADPSEWLDILGELLDGDQELIGYLQEAVGYSLTGHTFEECLFYLHGPTRAGKGVFIETVRALLGKPLSTEVDFSTFTSRRYGDTQNFDLAPLKPCRFVAASESTAYGKLNTATIKRITGGNDIYCAFKHQDHFSYRPQFKVWLSSNHPVNADPDDDAAWYRVHVIRFPNSFAGKEDKTLKAQLRRPDVLRGVLNWAVAGAIAWYGRGSRGLERPDQVKRATASHRHRLDFVQQWLDERVIDGKPDSFVPNSDLHQDYKQWCQDVGRKPKGIASLTQALRDKGYRAGEQKWVNGRNHRGCFGIELLWGAP